MNKRKKQPSPDGQRQALREFIILHVLFPDDIRILFLYFRKYSSEKNRTVKRLGISVGSHLSYVELARIYYLETTDNIHRLRLHAVNREIEFPAQLKEVQEQLDERFFRCHRSCIVNLDMITDIDYKDGIIFLQGGLKCPLAARTKRRLKQRMEERKLID